MSIECIHVGHSDELIDDQWDKKEQQKLYDFEQMLLRRIEENEARRAQSEVVHER
jgi:hypothetical protein